ncbi:MAG: hypothetical protein R2864_02795 [Syntrophotaleaceae bacterium]
MGLLLLILGLFTWRRPASQRAAQAQIVAQKRWQESLDDLARRIAGDPLAMQFDDWAQLGRDLQAALSTYAGLPPTTRGGSYNSFLARIGKQLTVDELHRAEAVLKGIEHLLAADHLDLKTRRALLTQADQLLKSLASRGDGPKANKELH